MRHYAILTAILCGPVFFASYASAEEAADRAAIGRAISALNEPAQHDALFTADGNASSELARLQKAHPLSFRIVGPPGDSAAMVVAGQPTVTISKQPWGEARIDFPAVEPRTVNRSITLVTSDVALAEAACTYLDNSATTQTIPLLFVMKKEGNDWKIASLRVLAPR